MSAANPLLSEVDIVAVVADLGELSKDIRLWHAGELADRLDAIIARRFGYIVRHVGEETAVAAIPAPDFTYVRHLPERKPNVKSQRLDQFAADLRAHPGEWGQWPNSINEITGYTVASRINRGADMRFSGGEFEAISRLGVLHVRYVGKEQANA
jgi:hypothetical protein